MGVDRHLHLGAYLRITVQKVSHTQTVRQCTGDPEHGYVTGEFCSKCGSAIKPQEIEEARFPSLYDLDDELVLGETLQEAGSEVGGSVIVAISNIGPSGTVEYDIGNGDNTVIDINGYDRPQSMRVAFAKAFETEISALKGHPDVLHAAVRFGFIDHWY